MQLNLMSIVCYWFEDLKSYCEPGGKLAISDEQVRMAIPFEGWQNDYLKWPDEHWEDRAKGVPCHDQAKNAYHIKYLANEIERNSAWIGRDLETRVCGNLIEGHHRLRAVKFLFADKAIVIPPPDRVQVFLPYPSKIKFYVNAVHFRRVRDTIGRLVRELTLQRLEERVQKVLNAFPLILLESGDFDQFLALVEEPI